jgi:3-(3-hydroxy-phenyl)propionate hydroxylase
VDVYAGHEVTEISQSDSGVSATARSLESGRSITVTAGYLWGCDGARSITRKSIGAQLEDLQDDQPWLVVDTVLKRHVDLPHLALQICDPARPTTVIPHIGKHRRWEFMLMPGETIEEMERHERVWELLAPWITKDDATIIRSVVYTFHALIVRPWRDRRIFLAGDAAHQMPPFLGQGMCAGIRDVNNLAWKLDLVRRGIAADALFDTYQTERAPHVRTIIERAVRAGRIIQTTDREVAARRDQMLRAEQEKSITIGQDGGLIESRMPALTGGVLSAAGPAGQIFPQSRVTTADGEEVLLDDVLGGGFALVAGKNAAELLADASSWREVSPRCIQVLTPGSDASKNAAIETVIDSSGVVSGWLDRHGAAAVRPDRYVYGAASSAAALEGLAANLRAQLGCTEVPA